MVAKARRDDEHARDLKLAWMTEMLHRQEKLPSLASLLSDRGGTERKQAVSQQKVVLKAICEQFGLKMHTRPVAHGG